MKTYLIALVVVIGFGCVSVRERRMAVTEFVQQLYPGWTVEGISVNDDGWTIFGQHVSIRVRDSKTGAIEHLHLRCDSENCVEADPLGGCQVGR